jgi:hypothetical protein
MNHKRNHLGLGCRKLIIPKIGKAHGEGKKKYIKTIKLICPVFKGKVKPGGL